MLTVASLSPQLNLTEACRYSHAAGLYLQKMCSVHCVACQSFVHGFTGKKSLLRMPLRAADYQQAPLLPARNEWEIMSLLEGPARDAPAL
jgi:hypothetical protein